MKLEWKKIKEEPYKAGWRKMLRKTFLLPNGKTDDYDIKDEKTSCHMLVLTPDKKVVLVKRFAPGTEKVQLEMPAGYVDKDENPEESAKREVLEELGMKGDVRLAGISTDDLYSNTIRHTFLIENCIKVVKPKLGKDEVFETVEMSLEDFRKHLRSGLMTHIESGYLALDSLGEL